METDGRRRDRCVTNVRLAGLFTALALASPAWCQTVTDQRVWSAIAVQGPASPRSSWRWAADFLVRSRDGARTMDFVAGRVAVGRDLGRSAAGGFGYAYGAGFPDAASTVAEHRFFQQVVWTGAGPHLSLRTRMEERLIDGHDRPLMRVRQQARVSWPLSAGGRLQMVAYDEIFANVNSTSRAGRGFDSNRTFAGVRRRVSPRSSMEVGYLHVLTRLAGNRHRRSHVLSATWSLAF